MSRFPAVTGWTQGVLAQPPMTQAIKFVTGDQSSLKVSSYASQWEVRCSSMVRAFTHGAMGHVIAPSWWTQGVLAQPPVTQAIKFVTGDQSSLKVSSYASQWEVRCSSMVRAFTHGAMGHRIDPSWWTHWAISRSSQCSTTYIIKVMVCANLSVEWCILKKPCC